jgi:hypothetical protein
MRFLATFRVPSDVFLKRFACRLLLKGPRGGRDSCHGGRGDVFLRRFARRDPVDSQRNSQRGARRGVAGAGWGRGIQGFLAHKKTCKGVGGQRRVGVGGLEHVGVV